MITLARRLKWVEFRAELMRIGGARCLTPALCLLLCAISPALAAQQESAKASSLQIEKTTPKPDLDNRPLPDIPKVLRDVNKNQRVLEEIRKLYTCHLSQKEDKLDSNGQVKSTSVKEYDVFYVGDDEVRHLLAKDGKPLDPH